MLINTKMNQLREKKKNAAFKDPGINNVTQSLPFLLTKMILNNSTFLQSKLLKV